MINVAAYQLRAFVERIERLEEEIRAMNADKSEAYKELKAQGYDVKAVKKVVAARRLESHVREEQDAIFEIYWGACHGQSPVHARVHVENTEKFPPSSAPSSSQAVDEESRDASPPSVSASPFGQDVRR